MTWREQIEQAHRAVEEAEAERTRVLAAATDAGISTRLIASIIGVGHATVWRWAGGRRDNRAKGEALLDQHVKAEQVVA